MTLRMPGRTRQRGSSQRTITLVDHGQPVRVPPGIFAAAGRTGGWGPSAESFLRLNERAFGLLDVKARMVASQPESVVELAPGRCSGAIPLRSAQTGAIVAGLVVKPRFDWAGVGAVMSETGWMASPQFLDLPLVPGSARQVPPWVLAGPVLMRLQSLLATIPTGFTQREEVRQSPRGTVLWRRYMSHSLATGAWHRLPCRFPDLGIDRRVLAYVRWGVERLRGDLVRLSMPDALTAALVEVASRMLAQLQDVVAVRPNGMQIDKLASNGLFAEAALRQGLQAIGWIADERGLGGGQDLDGLAWQLPLDVLWERYVEARVRAQAAREGGEVLVGRLRQTIFPLHWSTNTASSLTYLAPDIIVRRGRSLRVVDAKYKAHFAELDAASWTRLTDDVREAHRADVHQVLAYASLYEAEDVTATLVYPLRPGTWEGLNARGRDRASAELFHGHRRVRLEMWGLPFGTPRATDAA